jgi:hypothetical protein
MKYESIIDTNNKSKGSKEPIHAASTYIRPWVNSPGYQNSRLSNSTDSRAQSPPIDGRMISSNLKTIAKESNNDAQPVAKSIMETESVINENLSLPLNVLQERIETKPKMTKSTCFNDK